MHLITSSVFTRVPEFTQALVSVSSYGLNMKCVPQIQMSWSPIGATIWGGCKAFRGCEPWDSTTSCTTSCSLSAFRMLMQYDQLPLLPWHPTIVSVNPFSLEFILVRYCHTNEQLLHRQLPYQLSHPKGPLPHTSQFVIYLHLFLPPYFPYPTNKPSASTRKTDFFTIIFCIKTLHLLNYGFIFYQLLMIWLLLFLQLQAAPTSLPPGPFCCSESSTRTAGMYEHTQLLPGTFLPHTLGLSPFTDMWFCVLINVYRILI